MILAEKTNHRTGELSVPNDHDISVFDDILLPLKPQPAFLLRLAPSARLDEFVLGNNFSANKLVFKISVDSTGGFRRLGTDADRPRARLVLAGREEAL